MMWQYFSRRKSPQMGFSNELYQPLTSVSTLILRRLPVLKVLIATSISFAMVGAAAAADLPRPQPVYQQAAVGKMPIGKLPIIGKLPGKTPVGKYPTAAPLVTKG